MGLSVGPVIWWDHVRSNRRINVIGAYDGALQDIMMASSAPIVLTVDFIGRGHVASHRCRHNLFFLHPGRMLSPKIQLQLAHFSLLNKLPLPLGGVCAVASGSDRLQELSIRNQQLLTCRLRPRCSHSSYYCSWAPCWSMITKSLHCPGKR